MIICKICNRESKNLHAISHHVSMAHNIKLLDYYIKYEEFKIPTCIYCNKNASLKRGIIYYQTCGSKECISKMAKSKKHSEKTKKMMSEKRKKYLKNNPDKHNWKNNAKFISAPCEKLKDILKNNNILFESEINPLKNRFYSIDIAIINKGLGLEVNGNQHYNKDKILKSYYSERKRLIEQKGWKMIDIHYTKIYNEKFVNELINYIKSTDIKLNLDLDFEFNEKKKNYCIDCKKEIYLYSKRCRICNAKLRIKKDKPSYSQLLKEIKDTNYCAVGRKYGVSDAAIRKWIKNYENKKWPVSSDD